MVYMMYLWFYPCWSAFSSCGPFDGNFTVVLPLAWMAEPRRKAVYDIVKPRVCEAQPDPCFGVGAERNIPFHSQEIVPKLL